MSNNKGKARHYALIATSLLSTSLLLTACGGDNIPSSGGSSTSLSGTVATGAAVNGATINVNCQSGSAIASTTSNPQGQYSFTIPASNFPCVLEATGGTAAGNPAPNLYSFATGLGTANITPLTTLAMAQLTSTDLTDGSFNFSSSVSTLLALLNNPATIQTIIDSLNTALATYALPAGFNPFTTPLTAAAPGQAGNEHDGLLDQFSAANPSLDTLVSAAASGTTPTLGTPSYATGADDVVSFFNKFAGDYTLSVSSSGGESGSNAATKALFPQDSARTVHIKSNGDVSIDAVGRTITYSASTYTGVTAGSSPIQRTDFDNSPSLNKVLYRSAQGYIDLMVTYAPSTGRMEVAPQGFVNGEGYASLAGVIVPPPTALPSTPGACSNLALTFNGTTNALYSDGQSVCFTTISETTLAFSGKTLTNPTQNTAVPAPFSAWKFVDGNYTYEVVFNNSSLHEINLSTTNVPFLGQFEASTPALPANPTITNFSPTSGPVGSTVTITGTNFSTTLATNVVRFNGGSNPGPAPQAEIVSGSATQLVVKVPAGAQNGQLTVYNGNAVVSSNDSFTVTSSSGSGSQTGPITITSSNGGGKTAADIAPLVGVYTGTVGIARTPGQDPVHVGTCSITVEANGKMTVSAAGKSISATFNGNDVIIRPTANLVTTIASDLYDAPNGLDDAVTIDVTRGYVSKAIARHGPSNQNDNVECFVRDPHSTTLGDSLGNSDVVGGATASDLPTDYAGTYSNGTCSLTISNDGTFSLTSGSNSVSAKLGGDYGDSLTIGTNNSLIIASFTVSDWQTDGQNLVFNGVTRWNDGHFHVASVKRDGSLLSAFTTPACNDLVKQN